jgi:hypothetical protein
MVDKKKHPTVQQKDDEIVSDDIDMSGEKGGMSEADLEEIDIIEEDITFIPDMEENDIDDMSGDIGEEE